MVQHFRGIEEFLINKTNKTIFCPTSNVTRFGEISPLGHNFKNILQLYYGLISIWQTFEPTLEN